MNNQQQARAAWWEQDGVLLRVVSDLVAGELARMRPGRAQARLPWPPELHIEHDLGADSLELLALATALSEALHLHRSRVDDHLLSRLQLSDWVAVARDSLRQFSSSMTFRTSGSSGSHRSCTHPAAALSQEVAELARLLPGRRRIFSAVPSHHIYGFLFTVLLPHAVGGDGAEVIDLRTRSPAWLARELRAGDLVVAHPQFWSAFARLQPTVAPGVIGVTSTAPCPGQLADALRLAGIERLVQVYGSSETGGVGWRDSAAADFELLPYWSRPADAGMLERANGDGQTVRYAIQDKLEWSDANHFKPAGRIDQAVQVGGVNVFPAYVADVLAMHPAVLEAAVRLMRADEGSRLKAFVVPAPGHAGDHAALRSELLAWAGERLAAPERPTVLSFGNALPMQVNGKLADWIIDAWP